MERIVVTDVSNRKYDLLKAVMLQKGRNGGFAVLRHELKTALNTGVDRINYYSLKPSTVHFEGYTERGRLIIGCRRFYKHQARIIRIWANKAQEEINV